MDIIHHPSIILIIGRRRYGKSALGWYIMEKLHIEQNLPCFVVGFPQQKQHLLPDWSKPIDNVEELPDNCIAIVDEASFRHHSHKVRGKETEYMDKLIAVSGQKKQTIIFITHTMRKFAVTLLLDVDLLLCKEPSLLHVNLERAEVRKIMDEVKTEFKKLPREDVKKSTYVVSDGFKGFMCNPLPSFWSEELSEAWSGVDINGESEKKPEKNVSVSYPATLVFKIWFKPEDKERMLNIVRCDGKRLDDCNVFCTKDKCHIDFDMRSIGAGYYTPTSKRFNWEDIFKELKEKETPYVLDTETSIVEGKPYPIPIDHLIFHVEKKHTDEVRQYLDDYADKIKLEGKK